MLKSSVETVKTCPMTKMGQVLVRMTPDVIKQLAGAVLEKDEWLCIMLGEVSEDKYTITVDELYTPPRQHRTGGTCEIDEKTYPFPSYVKTNKVGSLHSHHAMSAFPSGTDTGEKGLFYTYPLSIVISSQLKSMEDKLLGFSYYGEQRVRLHCGAAAKLPVVIVPVGYEEDWPIASSASVHPPDTDSSVVPSLGDCRRWTNAPGLDRYHVRKIGRCGISMEKEEIVTRLFGCDGSPIIESLPPATPIQTSYSGGSSHYDKYKDRKWWKDDDYYQDDDSREEVDSVYIDGHEYIRVYDNNKTQEVPVVNGSSALIKVVLKD